MQRNTLACSCCPALPLLTLSPPHPTRPVQSPIRSLDGKRSYTFCIHARLLGTGASPPSSARTVINAADTTTWLPSFTTPPSGANAVIITEAWTRFCLRNVRFQSATSAWFTLPINVAVGTYYFDDATLEGA